MYNQATILFYVVFHRAQFWVLYWSTLSFSSTILFLASSKFDFILYADDRTLVSTLENFGTLSNVAELEYAINCESSKISSWFVSNMLVLSVAKSKLMLFFKSPKCSPKLTLTINGDIIEQVKEFNFLGITVDQNVT